MGMFRDLNPDTHWKPSALTGLGAKEAWLAEPWWWPNHLRAAERENGSRVCAQNDRYLAL